MYLTAIVLLHRTVGVTYKTVVYVASYPAKHDIRPTRTLGRRESRSGPRNLRGKQQQARSGRTRRQSQDEGRFICRTHRRKALVPRCARRWQELEVYPNVTDRPTRAVTVESKVYPVIGITFFFAAPDSKPLDQGIRSRRRNDGERPIVLPLFDEDKRVMTRPSTSTDIQVSQICAAPSSRRRVQRQGSGRVLRAELVDVGSGTGVQPERQLVFGRGASDAASGCLDGRCPARGRQALEASCSRGRPMSSTGPEIVAIEAPVAPQSIAVPAPRGDHCRGGSGVGHPRGDAPLVRIGELFRPRRLRSVVADGLILEVDRRLHRRTETRT